MKLLVSHAMFYCTITVIINHTMCNFEFGCRENLKNTTSELILFGRHAYILRIHERTRTTHTHVHAGLWSSAQIPPTHSGMPWTKMYQAARQSG